MIISSAVGTDIQLIIFIANFAIDSIRKVHYLKISKIALTMISGWSLIETVADSAVEINKR